MRYTTGFLASVETIFGKWVVARRWWIIVVTVLLAAASATGTRFLTINNDTRVFFSERNPQLRALETLENTYTRDENILFIIAPKSGHVVTRGSLRAVYAITVRSWQTPYSTRVDSITNFQHTYAEQDDLIVGDLVVDPAGLSDSDLVRIRNIALSEPILVNRLISASGHVTAVNVNVMLPGKSFDEVPAVAAFARGLITEMRRDYPDIDFYLTGMVMSDQTFGEVSQRDMTTLIPIMFAVLLVVVGMSMRSVSATSAVCLIILLSMITAMGLAGWFGHALNLASVNAPTIILTLAVADSVHILVTAFEQMGLGKSKRAAIAESIRVNLRALFLTSVTTAIGFLTMNFSDSPPFHDLGNIVALGVMAAFFYSVLFLPALLTVLPVGSKRTRDKTRYSCEPLASFVINRHRTLFWGALLMIVTVSTGIPRIELGDDWMEYIDERFEFRKATDFMEDNLSGVYYMEYSLGAGDSGGINEPAYLATLEAFANWFRSQPDVVHVNVITDTMKRLNKNMHGDDETYYRIPQQRDLAAQYLLLYEMSLPLGLDLNNQINIDKSATRLIVSAKGLSSTRLQALDERARAWLEANAPAPMRTYGTGLAMIWAHLSARNINSMLWASFGALVLISGILVIALRSLRLGLLSLIPNVAPAFMAFGVWGLLFGQVGLGLSVVVSLTLGIVVDDTVHFLSHYLRAREERRHDSTTAIRYAFNTVGAAMWITTATLVAGFLVLSFSGYKMNADMGLLSAITITLALALDFLFLPALLLKVEPPS